MKKAEAERAVEDIEKERDAREAARVQEDNDREEKLSREASLRLRLINPESDDEREAREENERKEKEKIDRQREEEDRELDDKLSDAREAVIKGS